MNIYGEILEPFGVKYAKYSTLYYFLPFRKLFNYNYFRITEDLRT
jgi:hypothetical protein